MTLANLAPELLGNPTADTQVTAVIALGVRAGRIDLIHAIGNSAKLQHVGTTGRRRTPTDEHQR